MTTAPLLEVRGLTVRYGGVEALSSVDLHVGSDDAGREVVGLIGPNGAGKTTCIDALSGFTRPASGQVLFEGRSFDGVAPHRRPARGFVRTFQSLELFDDLSVRDNLAVAATTRRWWSGVVDALRPSRESAGRSAGALVEEILELVGLSGRSDQHPSELSNGDRHLVAVGRALASRPSLVLLDEPAAGLDTAETAALRSTLARLPGRGVSVLLVDHDMSLIFGVCDRVYVLDFGRVIAAGTPTEVRRDPAVVAAYLGTESRS